MKLNSLFFQLPFLLLIFVAHPTIANLNIDKQALLNLAATVPHGRKLNWSYKRRICTSWVGVSCNENNTRVTTLRLPGIGFKGPLPFNILQKLDALSILSLRANRFSGNIPLQLLAIPSLRYVHLQQNIFSGNIPSNLSPQLKFLDLSFNSLAGSIPSSIQNATFLIGLNLQNNALTGPIPNIDLKSLKYVNFSNNQLNGSIPSSLKKFSSSSFQGNRLLCGSPLKSCSISSSPSPSPLPSPSLSPSPSPSPPPSPSLSPSPSPSPSPSLINLSPPRLRSPPTSPQKEKPEKKLSTEAIVGIAFVSLAILLLPRTIMEFCFSKKKEGENDAAKQGIGEKLKEDFSNGAQEATDNKLVFFGGLTFNFDLEDLLRASAEVMGKGNYGTTYKALMEEGTMVIVKRLKDAVIGKQEFERHMEVMGRVDHPNVVPLSAYYYSKDEKLLVYEYMLYGSFSMQLHGNKQNGRTLNWESRVKICLGAAKGITHIHSINGSDFAHGNIKSSNILLTRNLQASLSDFGLTFIMGITPISPRTAGYQAPEVIKNLKITQKSDVYSFGVLLLEALTGKSPIPMSGEDDMADLVRWVQSVVREEWTAEVFDVDIVKGGNVEEEMVQMLQIAMACVENVPEARPKMEDVVKMIEDIRVSDAGNRTSEEDKSITPPIQTP